jgi:hypothetical protein
MAPDDRFAEKWGDIPDPVAPTAQPAQGPALPPLVASPTRSATKMRRAVALAVCVAWPALVLLRSGLRPRISEQSSFVAGQIVLFGVLLVFAGYVAISRGHRGLGRSVSLLRLAAVGAPLAFALVGLSWLPAGSPGSFGDLGPTRELWRCWSLGLLAVVPTVHVGIWGMKRAFPSAAGWRGAALGAAVGLTGSVMLTLHCGNPFGGHVALAHGLPIVFAAILGAKEASRVARA